MNACVACLAIALLAAAADEASPAPPPAPWTVPSYRVANVSSDPVQPLRVGPLEIELESTTLKEIQSRVGRGTVAHSGDGGDSLHWLCFSLTRDHMPTTIVWFSSSEMGGGDVVDAVTVIESPTKSARREKGCPSLPSEYRLARLENGLWLGSSERDVSTILGTPKTQGDSRHYVFDGKSGKFEVSSRLSFKFVRGSVVGIQMTRTSTD
jgi:hypothetical protein